MRKIRKENKYKSTHKFIDKTTGAHFDFNDLSNKLLKIKNKN